jgi:integrase
MKNRPTWHANIRKPDGTRTVVNLGVPVRGKIPPSLRVESDSAFERSRAKAEAALAELQADLQDTRAAIRAQENVVRLKAGEKVKAPKIGDAPGIARKQCKGGEIQKNTVEGRMKQFTAFMRDRKGSNVDLSRITAEDVQAFFDTRTDSASVFTRRKGELRRLFDRTLPPGTPNPIDSEELTTPERIEEDTLHPHKPFTPDQLKRIFDTAKGTRIYGPIVAAAATGMRKGDVCTLKWESVFQDRGMIRVKQTRKTGREIMVPIPPRLRDVLKDRLPVGEYVFPEVADLYLSGKSGERILRKELKEVLAVALSDEAPTEAPDLKTAPPAEAYMKCKAYVEGLTTTAKRKARFIDTARLYLLDGLSYNKIQAQAGYAKAQISEALRDMEAGTGLALRRDPQTGITSKIRDLTTEQGEGRVNRQSVYDWHSFRTTFVTEALKAGWRLPDVQAVTGHSTVEIVLKHYYDPGEEHLKSLPLPASAAV